MCTPLAMKICVVGAGVAGLCAAREISQHTSLELVVLELTNHVGGTWYYEEAVGTDKDGLPIHTSMYKNLRTNLPRQTMELTGYPMSPEMASFPTSDVYQDYLEGFCKHFNLDQYIKHHTKVTNVKRVDDQWVVTYKDLVSGIEKDDRFDYIMLCNGHYSKPNIPHFKGEQLFKGQTLHSHHYRSPEVYTGKSVLLIGGGPSGGDISLDLAPYCSRVVFSHHVPGITAPGPANIIVKPDVAELTESGAVFTDGSTEDVDVIMYCTGYHYSCPFLDKSCGLTVHPYFVEPVHQQLVNINQPTMFVISLPKQVCAVALNDAQTRYVSNLLRGKFSLPSKEEMLHTLDREKQERLKKGHGDKFTHMLALTEDEYYDSLTRESGIVRVPPVLVKMKLEHALFRRTEYLGYRNYKITVLDENNYSRERISS